MFAFLGLLNVYVTPMVSIPSQQPPVLAKKAAHNTFFKSISHQHAACSPFWPMTALAFLLTLALSTNKRFSVGERVASDRARQCDER